MPLFVLENQLIGAPVRLAEEPGSDCPCPYSLAHLDAPSPPPREGLEDSEIWLGPVIDGTSPFVGSKVGATGSIRWIDVGGTFGPEAATAITPFSTPKEDFWLLWGKFCAFCTLVIVPRVSGLDEGGAVVMIWLPEMRGLSGGLSWAATC